MTTKEIKSLIRQKFAWPGGYQIFLVTSDGGELCCDCARQEYRQIVWDKMHGASTGWNVEGKFLSCDVEEPIYCDHCNKFFPPSHMTEEEMEEYLHGIPPDRLGQDARR
jgi:hypothetical protein